LNQRILKFCAAKLDGVVPDYTKYTDERLEEHKKEVNEALQTYIANLDAIKLRAGLSTVMHISSLGNKLLQDNKLNNALLAEEPDRCAAVIGLGINHLQLLASILHPYMPSASEAILTQIGSPGLISVTETWTADLVKPGQKIGEPKLLFTQIPASQIDEWREAFGGEEIRKQKALEAEKAAAKKAAKELKKQKKLALRQAEKAGEAPAAAAEPSVESSAPVKEVQKE
jgi:methionyl-tRNA synthetase